MGVICRSTKVYFSYKEPAKHIEYTSEILSGGPRGPLFSVTASDGLDNPIQGSTATACWSTILNKVRKERTRQGLGKTGTAVSGPEFFGYAMPEIAACIEGLDGADTCKNYVCRCLRMDSNRKGKPRATRRSGGVFVVESETAEATEPLEERPSKRRAAQVASRNWKMMEEEEESAEFSEEEEESTSEAELESDDEVKTARRSKKRAEPPKEESDKRIKTEQLL